MICVLLDESRMPPLPVGAAPESMIWQLLLPPPTSVWGLQEMAVTDTVELV